MAFAFINSTLDVVDGGTYTHNSSARKAIICSGGAASTATARTITALTATDGTNSVNGTVRRLTQQAASTRIVWIADIDPHASWANGATITLSRTWSGAMTDSGTMDVLQFSGSSVSDPYVTYGECENTVGTDPIWAVYPTINSVAVGDLLIVNAMKQGTAAGFAVITTPETYTEVDDNTAYTGRAQVSYVVATGTGTYSPPIDPTTAASNQGVAVQVQYREINTPSLTDVDTLPATPGESMTLAGTALDAANSGVRVRIVGTPTTYDALTGYSASSSIAATASMPAMLTEVPFTVGTSQSVEFISTVSGVASGVAFAGSIDVASGYAVVELVAPNTTASESVAANFGVTPADVDQLYYQTDSGNVVIAANGVPTAGPSYVAGTTLNAYLWDGSASSGRWLGPIQFQLTDDGDVVISSNAGKGGVRILDLMRRRRH